MSWSTIVILISITVTAIGLYREYQRDPKRYLALRMLFTIVAAGTLACLALPINYMGDSSKTEYRHVLLTNGFDKDSLQTADSIYILNASIHQQYPKAKLTANISPLTGAPLHILGYGLNKTELDELDSASITFHPSPIPDGIVAANWTDQLKTGEQFVVQLKYKNTGLKQFKILLRGLSTTLDSATIPASAQTNIELQTRPKSTGKVVFTILAINDKDTLQQEQLPVNIIPAKPLKVLILSASPDFETKFLKSWLGENGYAVASRSAITKGKFSQEYINLPKTDLAHLSASLLNQFDVLVADQSLLKTLTAAENTALQQAVSQKGMGVIIRADSSGKANSWLLRDFALNHIRGKQPAPGILHLRDKINTAKLAIDPTYISDKNNIQNLITNEQQHALAAAAINGTGRLIFTTINNSYNWQLSGNKTDYAALWSLLISKAARKEQTNATWQVQGDVPAVGTPVNILAENIGLINNITINQQSVYPEQDATSLFKQSVNYWPNNSGWQQIAVKNNEPYWWYVWSKRGWKSLNATNKLSVTAQYAKSHQSNSLSTQKLNIKSLHAVPKIYFFILFLMAVTFLWAERKFFNT